MMTEYERRALRSKIYDLLAPLTRATDYRYSGAAVRTTVDDLYHLLRDEIGIEL